MPGSKDDTTTAEPSAATTCVAHTSPDFKPGSPDCAEHWGATDYDSWCAGCKARYELRVFPRTTEEGDDTRHCWDCDWLEVDTVSVDRLRIECVVGRFPALTGDGSAADLERCITSAQSCPKFSRDGDRS